MTGFRPIRVKTAEKVLLIFDMCKYSGAILVKMFIFPPIFVLKCYNYAVSLLRLSLLCFLVRYCLLVHHALMCTQSFCVRKFVSDSV